MGRESYKDSKN